MIAASPGWITGLAEPGTEADNAAETSASGSLVPSTTAMRPRADLGPNHVGAPERFDYEALTQSSKLSLLESERRLDEIERVSIIAVGRELLKCRAVIQHELGHGHWQAWLTHRRLALTTANARMRAAAWADESAIVAELAAGVLYRAAGASTWVKQEIVQRLTAGEVIEIDHVVELREREKTREEADRVAKLTAQHAEHDARKRARKEARERAAAERGQQQAEERANRRIFLAEQVIDKLRSAFDDTRLESWSRC